MLLSQLTKEMKKMKKKREGNMVRDAINVTEVQGMYIYLLSLSLALSRHWFVY